MSTTTHTTTEATAGIGVGAVSTFRTRPVSGARFVIVVCDDCNSVINSGHQYRPDQLVHADRAAHRHNIERHPFLTGRAMGARRLLADQASGRERFRCPTDLVDHAEAIAARLYPLGTAGDIVDARRLFCAGYVNECHAWRA